jgi:SAM-dependent methyltransferase
VTKKKYSKSSDFYQSIKSDFFDQNDFLLKKMEKDNFLYSRQIRRYGCKLCDFHLGGEVDFSSHGVDYAFCESCGHLNGSNEDTKTFVDAIYLDDGEDYAANYLDENFLNRVVNIYQPKADFMLDVLQLDSHSLRVLDVGCGAGYFVYALLASGIAAEGIDVSQSMVAHGGQIIGKSFGLDPLKVVSEEDFCREIVTTSASVVSALGVIEHLRNPKKFFKAFEECEADFLYYSVPMFSLSAVLENVFPKIFPRQLAGPHTHLFTEQSIIAMHELMNVEVIGEWRFGTDAMDLYRHLVTSLKKNGCSERMIGISAAGLNSIVDKIQESFDRSHFCSEIHVVAKKK